MRPRIHIGLLPCFLFCWLTASLAAAADPLAITLPPPQVEGGKPLMRALQERCTNRDLEDRKLPPQTLANLLWAAFGINRPATGHRTAPSAMNSQEIDVYLAVADGVYQFDARSNALNRVLRQDIRAQTSSQPFATNAPALLLYVADLPRLAKAKPEQREFYAAIDTGCIVQNVYLFCASEGLASVVYAANRTALADSLQFRPGQTLILAQAVGFPKKTAP